MSIGNAPTAAAAGGERLHHLDGLRGWASVTVLLFHSVHELFSAWIPGLGMRWLGLVNDGQLAVFVFFVLSGVVLSQPLRRSRTPRRVARMALARYPRLAIPVAAVSLLALFMLRGGLMFNHAAGEIVSRPDWLGRFLQPVPTFGSWLRFSTFGVFFAYDTAQSYGPFLWTIPIELMGSIMLFGLFALPAPQQRARIATFGLCLVLTAMIAPVVTSFLCGALIAEIMPTGAARRLAAGRSGDGLAIAVLAVCWIASAALRPEYGTLIPTVIATALVLAVVVSRGLRVLLSSSLSQWLGRISFPLYLVHGLVICGPSSWLILRCHAAGLAPTAIALIVAPLTIIVSLLAAWLLSPLERFAVHASHRCADIALAITARMASAAANTAPARRV